MENITSSKLFTTRQGTILLGVIAAIIAAIALIVYLNHYRSSVSPPPVSVLVAKKAIPQGTSGDILAKSTSFYEAVPLPKDQVLSGAITDSSTLAGKVALTDISPNSQLTAAQFGAASGVQYQLGPNERAVVVDLGSPQAVGGQIGAGSHVDVWVTSSAQASSGVSRPIAKLLFQNMDVLGFDGTNATLKATPTQSGQLIFASSNDSIWLVLRPTIGTTPKPPVIGASQVTGG
ncbi:MAG TPA: Flp pilus assembly protein CpaB [Candidatus Acidoferrum sp.]|nr:Flp pilus assembly protein CpaB [Candidatus Acidoferrum sp.]